MSQAPSSPRRSDSEDDESLSASRKRKKAPRGVDTSLILTESRRREAQVRDEFVPPAERPLKLKNYPTEEADYVKETGTKLFQGVMDQREGGQASGRNLAQPFWTLPDRETNPAYYDIIKTPLGLSEVDAKLKDGSYKNIASVKHDISHAFWNAKRYHGKGAQLFLDAKFLDKYVKELYHSFLHPSHPDFKSTATGGGDGESDDEGAAKKRAKKVPNVWARLKSKLERTAKKTDAHGRVLSYMFMDLVPRADFPDYYRMIRRPRSFNSIYLKLKKQLYDTPEDFVDDVDLIFKNAQLYNLDTSQIWHDAAALMEYFHEIVDEILDEDPDAPPPPPKLKFKMSGDVPTIKLKVKGPDAVASPMDVDDDEEDDALAKAVAAIVGGPVRPARPPKSQGPPAPLAPQADSSAASTPRQPTAPLSQASSAPSSSRTANASLPPPPSIRRPRPQPTIISSFSLRQTGPIASSSPSYTLRNERGVKSHAVSLSEGVDTVEFELYLRPSTSPTSTYANGSSSIASSSPFGNGTTTTTTPLPDELSFPRTYLISCGFNNALLEPLPVIHDSSATPSTPGSSLFSRTPPTKWRARLPRNQGSWTFEFRVVWNELIESGQGEGRRGGETYEVFLRR